jgi:hypothetical protein
MLRAAYPVDGRSIDRWLRTPAHPMRALTFWCPGDANRDVTRSGMGTAPDGRTAREPYGEGITTTPDWRTKP